MKQNRLFGLSILAVLYAAAAAVGIVLCRTLPFSFPLSLLIADVCATVFIFLFSVLLSNASVYDPYWSVAPVVICAALAVGRPLGVSQWLLLLVIAGWGVRLTANFAYTFHGLAYQDWRYSMLRQKTGKLYPVVNFVGIHLVPTLVVYGCTLPAALVMRTDALSFSVPSALFVLLALCSFVLQGIADFQMHRYRTHRTTVFIRTGLWKYSRHPNYLGEILMWWSVYFASLCLRPDLWYLFVGPLANTCLFVFVSVPLADGRQSRKEGFEEYRRQTHAFLPIPKRAVYPPLKK